METKNSRKYYVVGFYLARKPKKNTLLTFEDGLKGINENEIKEIEYIHNGKTKIVYEQKEV